MSKALLVLEEMPKSCSGCPAYYEYYDVIDDVSEFECYCSATEDEDGEMKPIEIINRDSMRPDWCPLRPMPEQLKTTIKHPYGYLYNDGWNDCLKVIGGSDE